jgi:hypothetical protein
VNARAALLVLAIVAAVVIAFGFEASRLGEISPPSGAESPDAPNQPPAARTHQRAPHADCGRG